MAEEGWPRAAELCGGAPRWHGRINGDGEAVAVPLACARWRVRQGKASSAGELVQGGGRRAAIGTCRSRPYWPGGGESSKLKLGSACFMAGWGWAARELTGGAIDGRN